MRLTFSRRGDYAVRAMLALAEQAHGAGTGGAALLSARQIAERMHMPPPFAAHVLRDLMQAGLVAGTAGRAGGYRLAQPASGISLLQVVDAADRRDTPPACVLRGVPCDPAGRCAVHDTVAGARSAARAALQRTTMADLVQPGTTPPGQ